MNRIWHGTPGKADQSDPLGLLLRFARVHSLRVTSGEFLDGAGHAHYLHAGHNPGSLHYVGRAIDVSTHGLSDPEIEHLAGLAQVLGINTYAETERPAAGVWTGPHLHLSVSPPGTHEV